MQIIRQKFILKIVRCVTVRLGENRVLNELIRYKEIVIFIISKKVVTLADLRVVVHRP